MKGIIQRVNTNIFYAFDFPLKKYKFIYLSIYHSFKFKSNLFFSMSLTVFGNLRRKQI